MSYIGNQPIYQAFITDTFSGNGSTTNFTLQIAPVSGASLLVVVSGLLQDPNTYTVQGNVLSFSAAPVNGTNNISVRYLALPASNIATNAYRTITEVTAAAGQTIFSVGSYTPGYIDVFRNGVKLGSEDYTATCRNSVTLVNACNAGDLLTTVAFLITSVLDAIPPKGGSITAGYLDVGGQSGGGAMILPNGSTAQRPASPANGMVRMNNSAGSVEYWNSTLSKWVLVGGTIASGGQIIDSGEYRYHVFTQNGTFTVETGSVNAEVLIVAGGGSATGGDYSTGSGGGGGGGIVNKTVTIPAGSYTVTVGQGGTGGIGNNVGNNGENSSISGLGLATAIGGGRGAAYNGYAAGNGGSGGGGAYAPTAGGTGTSGQGNAGGTGTTSRTGGGGGGYASTGGNAGAEFAGDGGSGGYFGNFAIAGYPAGYYGGGGGGGASDWTDPPAAGRKPGRGGNGGGGKGGYSIGQQYAVAGENGVPNTGGGAGGSAANGSTASATGLRNASGGSGIVIFRYLK